MPREATGGVYPSKGRWYARVSLGTFDGKKLRPNFALRADVDEAAARARGVALGELAARLRKALRSAAHLEVAIRILGRAAGATEAQLAALRGTVDRLVAGEVEPKQRPGSEGGPLVTFEDVANAWTSGRLARTYPDQIREKRSARDDAQRLRDHVLPLLGAVPMRAFSLDHAEQVMRALPPHLGSSSRRLVACAVNRIVRMSVYPLRLLAANPLPTGWMPKVRGCKQQAMPRPSDVDALVACATEPLVHRLLVGFLAREGMRHEEGEDLSFGDLDLDAGLVRLERNKTDEPRSWVMRSDVVRALVRWKQMRGSPKPAELVFPNSVGGRLHWKAIEYRDALKRAGVDRAELFKEGPATTPTGLHALRALFVTEALARGKSERFISDRTGHKSSTMISVYQRRARTFEEAQIAPLADLDTTIAWEDLPSRAPVKVAERIGGRLTGRRDRRSRSAVVARVGRRGLEPRAYGLKDVRTARDEGQSRSSAKKTRHARPSSPAVDGGAAVSSEASAIDGALSTALDIASREGRWDVVARLVRELEARRTRSRS